MKSIISSILLIGTISYAQCALSDCNYPKMSADIPNGSKATEKEMLAALTSFKTYQADMDAYLACLDDELALVPEDLDIYPDIKKANNLKYDAAVEVMQQGANELNEEIRAYKAAQ